MEGIEGGRIGRRGNGRKDGREGGRVEGVRMGRRKDGSEEGTVPIQTW